MEISFSKTGGLCSYIVTLEGRLKKRETVYLGLEFSYLMIYYQVHLKLIKGDGISGSPQSLSVTNKHSNSHSNPLCLFIQIYSQSNAIIN